MGDDALEEVEYTYRTFLPGKTTAPQGCLPQATCNCNQDEHTCNSQLHAVPLNTSAQHEKSAYGYRIMQRKRTMLHYVRLWDRLQFIGTSCRWKGAIYECSVQKVLER